MKDPGSSEGAVMIDLEARRRGGEPPRRRPVPILLGGIAGVVILAVVLSLTLRVSHVRVTGLRSLSPSEVAEASGIHGGERLLLTRMGPAAGRVERLPGVREASVSRRPPATVVIAVRERVPLVRLAGQDGLVADASGVIFPYAAADMLPMYAGWTGEAAAGKTLDKASVRVLRDYLRAPERFRAIVRAVTLADGLAMVVGDGLQVQFGRPKDVRAKAVAALAVYDEARAAGRVLTYIDVRAPRTPVAGEPTPEPSPAAVARTSGPDGDSGA